MTQDWTIMSYAAAAAGAAAAAAPTVEAFENNESCKPAILYTYSIFSVCSILPK